MTPAAERFDGVEVDIDTDGEVGVDDAAAFVRGALARLAVTPRNTVVAGDHALVLLDVVDLHRDPARRPLALFDSALHTLTP